MKHRITVGKMSEKMENLKSNCNWVGWVVRMTIDCFDFLKEKNKRKLNPSVCMNWMLKKVMIAVILFISATDWIYCNVQLVTDCLSFEFLDKF